MRQAVPAARCSRSRRRSVAERHGVILQLAGPKVGAEVSAAVGGVTVTMQ